ncbi:UDP-Glycosyltransferase [Aspergillus hancockii]|nr:UDP-Glycosyltransferase [Aspergillus hancockii]
MAADSRLPAINEGIDEGIWDPPPPYETASGSAETQSPGVNPVTPSTVLPCLAGSFPELSSNNDGRVDMRVAPRFSRNLEWLMRNQPAEGSQLEDETVPSVPSPAWDIRLNIVIQVVGSRGDVQPFVALGTELQKYGHRVRLATHSTFEQFVTTAGLEFYPIGGDPVELMSYMVRNPGLIPSIQSLRAGDIQRKRASIVEILDGCWQSCLKPDPRGGRPFVADAIIANPPSFAHVHWDLINAWRRNVLNLDPIPATEGASLAETLKVPFTYCWSPALVPKPEDWGPHIDVCGFFFRKPPAYEPPSDLHAFLHAGPPPFYIGFGSIVLEDVEKTMSILLDAIRETGVRAIISCGWSNLQGLELPNVHYIGDCPHEWLFQHVAAVVHHGGAGTTACGLRNGKPTIVVPFFGDQPFWGSMIAAAGAGPDPIPHKSLTARKLADAINYCLTPEAADGARAIADSMHLECGVRAAVDSFHAHLPRHKMQCDLVPGEPAVWKFKKGKQIVKLSKIAAWALKSQGRLQEKHLKRYQTKPFIIDIRRWDPFTAVSSASLSTISGMADATAGILIDPYKEYKRLQSGNNQDASISKTSSRTPIGTSPTTHAADPNPDSDYAKQMALASAISLGKFLGRSSRGALVDLPLAAVEGMRAVPRLYGEEVWTHAPVRCWRSGAEVAWSTFRHGMYEGITDIFVHTYQGKKKQGALGVAKGLTKGLVGVTVKTGAAMAGLIAYPNQGVYQSLRSAMRKGLPKQIEEASWAEAGWAIPLEEVVRDKGESCRTLSGIDVVGGGL